MSDGTPKDPVELTEYSVDNTPVSRGSGLLDKFPSRMSATDGGRNATTLAGHVFHNDEGFSSLEPADVTGAGKTNMVKAADGLSKSSSVSVSEQLANLSVDGGAKTRQNVHKARVLLKWQNVTLNSLDAHPDTRISSVENQALQRVSNDDMFTVGDISSAIVREVNVLNTYSTASFPLGISMTGCRQIDTDSSGTQRRSFTAFPGRQEHERELPIFETTLPDDKLEFYTKTTYQQMIAPLRQLGNGEFTQVPKNNRIYEFCIAEKNRRQLNLDGMVDVDDDHVKIRHSTVTLAAYQLLTYGFNQAHTIGNNHFVATLQPDDNKPFSDKDRALHMPPANRASYMNMPFTIWAEVEIKMQTTGDGEKTKIPKLDIATAAM